MRVAQREGEAMPPAGEARQAPFARVAPLIAAALVIGVVGGFALAATLTVTRMLGVTGLWWAAAAQAHGHLQLYGWAGLFVLGVALHFVPRLRGAPLVGVRWIPAILWAQAGSLALRAIGQTLLAGTGDGFWGVALLLSGALEVCALWGVAGLLAATLWHGPALAARKAMHAVLPLIGLALAALATASLVNLINVARLAGSATGLIPGGLDGLNVTLGLLGFLVPVALAMSAQALPMYAGLSPFPRRLLWPLAGVYGAGLIVLCVSEGATGALAPVAAARLGGAGMLLLGATLLVFVGVFVRMMALRGRLPKRVAELAPSPGAAAKNYHRHVAAQRGAYGPFVALVASAYLWALLGGAILVVDGAALLVAGSMPLPVDALRHSLALGFIALLISGIAPRMLPGFSGGAIVSPHYVTATLWLGNIAAILRVGSLLAQPLLAGLGFAGQALVAAAFGVSGPVGLALAVCLLINLWPAVLPGKLRKGERRGGRG
jgi:uncharacterized protein involved in response to NO